MRRTKAFTLIELLVVVAIIAVLIAILLPSLGKARDRAKATACLTNVRSVYYELALYANSYNDRVPIGYTWSDKRNSGLFWEAAGGPHAAPWTWGSFTTWGLLYAADFMKTPKVWYCPSETSLPLMFNSRPGSDWNNYNRWPPGNWGMPDYPGWSNQTCRAGFKSRPIASWSTFNINGDGKPGKPNTWPRLSSIEHGALITEVTNHSGVIRRHKTGQNVVYSDGSGQFVQTAVFSANMTLMADPAGSVYNNATLGATSGVPSGFWIDLDRNR